MRATDQSKHRRLFDKNSSVLHQGFTSENFQEQSVPGFAELPGERRLLHLCSVVLYNIKGSFADHGTGCFACSGGG
jgi:hypothetical protein